MSKLENPITIRCILSRVRWQNSEGSWTVASIRPLDSSGLPTEERTAVGPIPYSETDETIECVGSWEEDPKHGEQFKVLVAYKIIPTTVDGLRKYLADNVDGIGPSKAAKLTEHFGSAVFQIIEKEPLRLTECKGISEELALKIQKSWSKDTGTRQVAVFLAQHGISSSWTPKIIETFGLGRAIAILKENPYALTRVPGVGFKTADYMAQLMGFPAKSPQRTEAAFTHILWEGTLEGNVFMHEGQLIEEVKALTKATDEEVRAAMQKNLDSKVLVEEVISDGQSSLKLLYLPRLHRFEAGVAQRITELNGYSHTVPGNLTQVIERAQDSMHIPFSPRQRAGIQSAFEHHVCVITGGPGTGKTTIVKAIVQIAERLGLQCVLAAPTGRAARRLGEVSERTAMTLHRLLGYDGENNTFAFNRQNPLQADILLVDESSMVDIELAYRTFDAVPDNCSVIFIGDSDQLPSVGPGMVLSDLIKSEQVKVTILDQVFRQAEDSLIVTNSHKIKRGETPVFPPAGSPANCYMIPVPKIKPPKGKATDDVKWLHEKLSRIISVNIPEKLTNGGKKIDPVRDVQVLVPMKKGTAGVEALNQTLQAALNDGQKFTVRGKEFRIGDRVMQLRNNYDQGMDISNGDIGFIQSFDDEQKAIKIDFYGRVVDYPYDEVKDLQLAYAQTIHKSQGSEYPVVIIVLLMQHYAMLERNLLYTANTRAKNMCLYLSSRGAVEMAAKRCEVKERNTFLSQRLRQGAKAAA